MRHVWNAQYLTIYFLIKFSHNTFVVILNVFKMVKPNDNDLNGNGTNTYILGIFLLLAYILSDLKMVTIDCLGHNKFNWEVNKLIFSCSGWYYCGISHKAIFKMYVQVQLPFNRNYSTTDHTHFFMKIVIYFLTSYLGLAVDWIVWSGKKYPWWLRRCSETPVFASLYT